MRIRPEDILRVLFVLAFPALYVALIGRFGWSDTDDGFILGYAWRILNGEVPYRDFVTVRPPLSIYLHSVWFRLFPEHLVFLGGRYVYVLQLLVSACLAMRLARSEILKADGDAAALPWNSLALVGFALSVGALTPMPWHTVDGIFFAVLALSLIARSSWWCVVAGAVALWLACLAKQSFYPLVALCFAILWLLQRRRHALLLLGMMVGLAAAFSGLLVWRGVWEAFDRQTMGATTVKDAIDAGVMAYLRLPVRPLMWGSAIALAARWGTRRCGWAYTGSNDVGIIALVFLLEGSYRYHKRGEWFDVQSLGLAQVLFVLAFVGMVLWFRRGAQARQAAVWLAGLMGIAWCSSISWGFQTPVLFATPLLLGTFLLLTRLGAQTWAGTSSKGVQLGLLGLVLLALLPTWHPYRDGPRPTLVCNMGTVNHRLAHVMSTQDHCDQLAEALGIRESFQGKSMVFLPAFTLQGYLAGVGQALPSNWPMLGELGKDSAAYQKAIDEKVQLVVIDRREGNEFTKGGPNGKFFVPSVVHVRQHWHLVKRERFYEVYANPRL